MIEHYPLFVNIIGWVLLAGGFVISIAPLQFITRGRSALGDDGVLHYFLAFSGSLNVVWGLIMLVAASNPIFAEKLALPCAVGFALLSLWRIPLCRLPQIQENLGRAPMVEVFVFALISAVFAFVGFTAGA